MVKKLLIAVLMVITLTVVGVFLPARQVTIEGIGTLSFETAASPASLDVKKGTFTKQAGTGNQPITGVGFQPKAVILFWTNQTAAGFSAGLSLGVGFAASATQEFALSIAADDNVATTNDGSRRSNSNSIIILTDGTPTMGSQADVFSFNADGFTVNWTTNNGSATIIHYIALGGVEITNTYAGTFDAALVLGNQAVTGVGFQPDFVMFLAPQRGLAADTDKAADGSFGIGFMTAAAEQASLAFQVRSNQATATTAHWQKTDHCILALRQDIADASATFVSMDTLGFTINWDFAYSTATAISFLAIKGGQNYVGNFNQPASTGQQPITTPGFRPNGLVMFSFNDIAQTAAVTVDPAAKISIGAAQSSTARGDIWGHHDDLNDPTATNSLTKTTCAITLATGPTTVNAEADFVSFDATGFTLNWTSADATARQIIYWAMGTAISNTPSSKAFGAVSENTDYWSNGGPNPFPNLIDGECFFTLTNSSISINVSIRATNFTGATGGWTLASSPGVNIVTLKAGTSGDDNEAAMVTLTTIDQTFIGSPRTLPLGVGASWKWEIKLETGTFTERSDKTSIITLTATIA